MTLFTSNLPNDRDMIHALGSMAIPLPIATGDVCFSGVGDGHPLLICLERKKIGDLCSCILDSRYLHQLQIVKTNGADVLVLVVEGDVRPNPDDGLLEVPVWRPFLNGKHKQTWEPVKPTMTYSRFDQYLTELDYLVGVMVKRSKNVHETAAIIKAVWDNFQTPYDKHNSLHQIFKPAPQQVQLVKPSLVRRVAAELSGIGWERSKVVAERFPSVKAMVDADTGEWVKLEGIGKKTAQKVVNELNGGSIR